MMKRTSEADALAHQITALIHDGRTEPALAWLAPVLSSKTAFHLLDRIGARIGAGPLPETNKFLTQLAAGKMMGAWPLVGSALAAQLDRDLVGALRRCRKFIVLGDVWYAADTLAERVPGAALVADFDRTLGALGAWRTDPNRWVRKSAGVAVHLWAKRSRGEPTFLPKVRKLLAFLEPLFTEQDLDAAKGIGWALKTLGRFFPGALELWLVRQASRDVAFRAVVLRKAVKYLPAPARNRVRRAAGQ